MDRTGDNLYYYFYTIIGLLGSTPTFLLPIIGSEGDFLGAVDLVTMEAIV